MKISEVIGILGAKVLCGAEHIETEEVSSAFGADMMSDVLAFMDEKTLLLTGMVNLHVIKTAEMIDIRCIVVVRDKAVPDEIIELAKAQDMIILATEKTLYASCGLLYGAGLPGCTRK